MPRPLPPATTVESEQQSSGYANQQYEDATVEKAIACKSAKRRSENETARKLKPVVVRTRDVIVVLFHARKVT